MIRKVEAWGKRSARAIKRNRIDFLNRKGEKFDWDNDDLSDLERVDEQPKMIDPGVADVPEDDKYDEDPDQGRRVEEKPSYVTRAVAARERAGLNRESPRQARGVDERVGDVIEIDDGWMPADVPPVKPTMTIKTEPGDIPEEPEELQEVPRRSQRNRVPRVPFEPVMEGQRYKEVGFLEKEEFRGDADNSKDLFQTGGAEELNILHTAECVPDGTRATDASYFGEVRTKRGMSSCGQRDQGVYHPRVTV